MSSATTGETSNSHAVAEESPVKQKSTASIAASKLPEPRRQLEVTPHLPEGRRPALPRQSKLVVDTARLMQYREAAALDCREMARAVELKYSHYCGLEVGRYPTFRRATALRIAQVLNCAVEDIASGPMPAAPRRPRPPRAPLPHKKAKLPPYAPLRHGPYHAPQVQLGDALFCSRRGRELTVVDWTQGALAWPRATVGGQYSLIMCGDLETAVRIETLAAVACAWGVSVGTVTAWRAALNGVLPEPRAKPTAADEDAGNQAEPASSNGAGLPPTPRRPEPSQQPRPFAALPEQLRRFDTVVGRAWTAKEERQLGTVPDARLAIELGCATSQVRRRRRELDIPPYASERRQSNGLPPTLLLVDTSRLKQRRERAGLTRTELARLAGLHPRNYGSLENGEVATFRCGKAERIARALECSVEDIARAAPPNAEPMVAESALPALLEGPYRAPDVRLGDRLWCEYRGCEEVVETFSHGPVPWPCFRRSDDYCHIVCGDLARAVRAESSKAVRAWWRVSGALVARWRRALDVTTFNEGTLQLRLAVTQEFVSLDGGAKTQAIRPRPFAPEYQKRRQFDSAIRRDWTAKEEELLGSMADGDLAVQLSCSKNQVWRRRHELAIPPFVPEGRRPFAVPRSRLLVDPARMKLRREMAFLTSVELAALAGLNCGNYRNLESGKQLTFRLATAELIARALDCSVEDIATAPEPVARRRNG